MTYGELLALAHRMEGVTLTTVTGRSFRVGVACNCPYFIPLSTGLGRSDGRLAAERFLARFNETGSPRVSDYGDVTRNASYFLPLMQKA